MLNRSASPCLVNLISKDTHLVFYIYLLFIAAPIVRGFFVLGPCFVVWFFSSLAMILLRKRELVVLL